jgi:HicB family
MEMARFVAGLEADLAAVAAVGDDETAAAAERLIQAIRGSAGLRLLDVLGEAALEVSDQLPAGHVEVRLSGQDPALVYVAEAEAEPETAPDDGLTARITLRLPEALKTSVEAAAAREGISVNSWLVRALSRSTAPRVQRSGNRLQGFAQS